jgi:hypothetical protein
MCSAPAVETEDTRGRPDLQDECEEGGGLAAPVELELGVLQQAEADGRELPTR